MPSPSPLHPPESVRRFTSLKVGVLLLFVLLLTLFGVQEGEGDAQHEAQQQLASASGNTHTESIELPLGRQAAQTAGSAQGQDGQGADRQANAQGAGQPDDRRAAPVSKDNAPQDKTAASLAGPAGTNGTPADAMADSQAGPAVPAGESVMAPEDDDQPHQPATGDAMIELPGPPSFSLTHDPAGGIRLAGEVPDDDTRNQWMNAIRLGARGESVEGSLRLRHIDGHAAARWEPQLTALVALVRERNISELRVRGDVVEVFGGAQTPAQGRETLELIRAQVPNGYRVLARDEAGAAGASRLAVAGAAAQGAQRLADVNRPAGRDARAQAEAQKAADARNSRDSRNARDTRQAAADSRNLRTAAAGSCPRSLKQLSAPIFFKSGSSSLSPAETRRLQQLGACLGRTAWVRVTGYADPRYSAAYNKTLSERRARAVAGAISEGGFSSARITVVGAGKTSTRTKVRVDKATLQRARRVDILVG